jgi:hypothetical protein
MSSIPNAPEDTRMKIIATTVTVRSRTRLSSPETTLMTTS